MSVEEACDKVAKTITEVSRDLSRPEYAELLDYIGTEIEMRENALEADQEADS